ncbi:N-acetyltransferase family protein [Nocardiopsis sp. CA-288880]|uniref:GNAT family N-acetyltransferase n=1 Tax=Nocardiopsis sp. CA-288880 TaxID=3239995 RepID=UPI003D96F93E
MSDPVVRPAGAEDLNAVSGLRWRWSEENHGTPEVPLEEFASRFVDWAKGNGASHHCFVAVLDGDVVGMAWLAVTQRVPHPRAVVRASGDVQCVYVRPEHRDRGLGALLVEAVLGLARALGLERVTVHSTERAVAAYERGGFAVSPLLLQTVPGSGGAGARG